MPLLLGLNQLQVINHTFCNQPWHITGTAAPTHLPVPLIRPTASLLRGELGKVCFFRIVLTEESEWTIATTLPGTHKEGFPLFQMLTLFEPCAQGLGAAEVFSITEIIRQSLLSL